MKNNQQAVCHLGEIIESAIAMIDPKGTNDQISQAMSIVHMAFSDTVSDTSISSGDLYERASQMYPQRSHL
jgi:hypothetical protein